MKIEEGQLATRAVWMDEKGVQRLATLGTINVLDMVSGTFNLALDDKSTVSGLVYKAAITDLTDMNAMVIGHRIAFNFYGTLKSGTVSKAVVCTMQVDVFLVGHPPQLASGVLFALDRTKPDGIGAKLRDLPAVQHRDGVDAGYCYLFLYPSLAA